MRDRSSTVWDTLLIKASSPEAEAMQFAQKDGDTPEADLSYERAWA